MFLFGWFGGMKEKIAQRTGNQPPGRSIHGCDVFLDIHRHLPDYAISTIFDIGAHIGQSAREFRMRFPAADIYCFEPVPSTFRKLCANIGSSEKIRTFPLAFGSSPGSADVILQPDSSNNSLQNTAKPPLPEGSRTERVDIDTLDDFCHAHDISQIDYLKIDTEGYDLEVLKGAEDIMRRRCVTFIQTEAGMNPYNQKHVPLRTLQEFLEAHHYALFGLYDQTLEWTGEARLRYCNAVFILS
jgi:FkbM family methyltransferase